MKKRINVTAGIARVRNCPKSCSDGKPFKCLSIAIRRKAALGDDRNCEGRTEIARVSSSRHVSKWIE
jgi:hypothetical protein